MKLIVGLGNPGKEYDKTRHNVGFITIDEFAKKYNATFKLETKLQGEIATINIDGEKVILLKPVTYMNLSGDSISKVMYYYKIDTKDLFVISDDMDMDVGKVRLRAKGSAGGHNGIKSIIEHIGPEFYRAKIGISKGNDAVNHVLGKFTSDEFISISLAASKVCEAILDFIKKVDFEQLMNKYN